MTFLFPAMLIGAVAAAAPVVIHLMMRSRPRQVVFPALRFVKLTHRGSSRSLKLKHWLLLALRVAAMVLIALLLARPTVPGFWPASSPAEPVAAAIVLDTSGSMSYRHQRIQRLAAARRQAAEVIASLPAGSRAAVLETHQPAAPTSLLTDPALLTRQVNAATVTPTASAVGPALAAAARLLAPVPLARKEIYVFTDMTRPAWRHLPAVGEETWPVTVVDVGVDRPVNRSLGPVELSPARPAAGQEVRLRFEVRCAGPGGAVPVELSLGGRRLAEAVAEVASNGSAVVEMSFVPSGQGRLQGELRLGQGDAMALDDRRFVTVVVTPPVKVLLLAEPAQLSGGAPTVSLLQAALDAQGPWLAVQVVTPGELTESAVSGASAVVCADVVSLTDAQWSALESMLRRGGGLWLVPGPALAAEPEAVNGRSAQRSLPGRLGEFVSLPGPVRLADPRDAHRLVADLAREGNPPLSQVAARARWRLSQPAEGARAIARFADGEPAMMIRRVGRGRSLLWTFGCDGRLSNVGRFPRPHLPILAGAAAAELTGRAGRPTGYRLGQWVRLAAPAGRTLRGVTIVSPSGRVSAGEVRPGGIVAPVRAETPGNWQVTYATAGPAVEEGFSVNIDPVESDLRRVDADALTRRLAGWPVRVVDDASAAGREGRRASRPLELAPLALVVLLAVLIAEALLANRFYARAQPPADG